MLTIRHQASFADHDRPVIVLTTYPGDRDAEAFARTFVEERLAACVNVLPAMASIYRWEGAIQHDAERQIVIKTIAAQLEALAARLRELHPYDVPEFLVFEVSAGSETYLEWVGEAVVSNQ